MKYVFGVGPRLLCTCIYMHVATIFVCIVDFLDFDGPALASLHALML